MPLEHALTAATSKGSMDALIIQGGRPLAGHVEIGGAKNAALPIMAATLLSPAVHTLRNVPVLSDTRTMSRVLERLGAQITFKDHVCTIDTRNVASHEAPYELVKTMRASVYVLGPLIARFGEARVSLPGGCAWGPRPVNLHLEGLNALGANLRVDHGYITGQDVRLRGAHYEFPTVSVGATAQLMMASALAHGTTTLDNVALEPDITELGWVLVRCGARIEGLGTRRIVIEGVPELSAIDTTVIPDRIEAATFMAAAAITGSTLTLERCEPAHVGATIDVLEQAGCEIVTGSSELTVKGPSRPRAIRLTTDPFPGFPTDMQAQMMAVCSVADGISTITDTVYRDRFTHVPELQRLGARIRLNHNSATVVGVESLEGAPVMATDIRASAALVLAGLVADGETRISRIYHLDRGYEAIDKKLERLGAGIARVRE
jgi:UDP-N-acetylglucosamine 1-carboxyvinyltransferase